MGLVIVKELLAEALRNSEWAALLLEYFENGLESVRRTPSPQR